MNKRDVKNLKAGDHVALKHNLGSGHVISIAWDRDQVAGLPRNGRYPMIEFEDDVTKIPTWATYLIVGIVTPKQGE